MQQYHKLLAILVDPEKVNVNSLEMLSRAADILLVGGSSGENTEDVIAQLRRITHKPIVLFPGQVRQFSPHADALLYLSVISSTNAEVLVGRQLKTARMVQESGIESIPMGYILVDGGKASSVEKASMSDPIPGNDVARIVDTAIMGELLGKKLLYLEAGSGALSPISPITIKAVRSRVSVPLFVGGGICTTAQMQAAYEAGADVVVIGNHFEQHPEQAAFFAAYKNSL